MTAPYDIDPKNESWTQDEMKLRKKGGWSKQYSAALAGDSGFNRWWHNRYMDQYVYGSNPAPLNDGPNVSGGVVHIAVALDNNVAVLSSGIDWRDRHVSFFGNIFEDNVTSGFMPGGSNASDVGDTLYYDDNANTWKRVGFGGQQFSNLCWATADTWAGNDTLVQANRYLYVARIDSTGTLVAVAIGAKTNGDLAARVLLPSPVSDGVVVRGFINYAPMQGFRDHV